MQIKLSDSFDYKRLLRFTLPSIVMMIVTSVYGVVDGFFVSNFVGKTPFAAVNFIMPFLMMLGGVGFMFGTGGGALVAKTLGEKKERRARELFSLIIYATIITSVAITAFGLVFIRPIAEVLGAEGQMLTDCVVYGRIILAATPFYMLQFAFQSFCVTSEKPNLGLVTTVAAGVTNIALDALFIVAFDWGLVGAASATAISQAVGGLIPLVYFACPNSSLLRLTRTRFDGRALLKTCTNGSSELMSNISMSLVGMLYNIQLLRYAGEDGVAAYGVLMYVNMIFLALFIGYSVGSAPIIGYNYGAQNHTELHRLLRRSLVIIGSFSVSMLALSFVLARPLSAIFVGYDEALLEMTCRGFFIFSFSFLFAGLAIFGSSFFTSLNNGLISAIVSFLRTLVFQVAAVLLLPLIWELDGIWLSVVVAEFAAAAVNVVFLVGMRKRYKY